MLPWHAQMRPNGAPGALQRLPGYLAIVAIWQYNCLGAAHMAVGVGRLLGAIDHTFGRTPSCAQSANSFSISAGEVREWFERTVSRSKSGL